MTTPIVYEISIYKTKLNKSKNTGMMRLCAEFQKEGSYEIHLIAKLFEIYALG